MRLLRPLRTINPFKLFQILFFFRILVRLPRPAKSLRPRQHLYIRYFGTSLACSRFAIDSGEGSREFADCTFRSKRIFVHSALTILISGGVGYLTTPSIAHHKHAASRTRTPNNCLATALMIPDRAASALRASICRDNLLHHLALQRRDLCWPHLPAASDGP